jgi:hypothetical protein
VEVEPKLNLKKVVNQSDYQLINQSTLASLDIWRRLFPARRNSRRFVPLFPNSITTMFNNNINLFKFCSALRVLGYFMILLFAAIVALTYYAVVFVTWGPLLFPFRFSSSSFSALFILLLFHTLVSHSYLHLFYSIQFIPYSIFIFDCFLHSFIHCSLFY